uniref:Transposon Ty3-I Gag-Pol polyprotein n=2 Tax=Cajanus cajan TaxID=3821 RepID=A0A151TPN6_CAJCA|nr:Transposon Ty3-I Gag-Pol polyprotein [Cajanus cajan]
MPRKRGSRPRNLSKYKQNQETFKYSFRWLLEILDCVFDDAPLGFEKVENDGLKVESQAPLEEVNLGTIEKRRITYVSKLAEKSVKEQIVQVLHEYKDCFAWDYEEMPGLDNRLPMILGKKPVKQNPRRFAPQVIEKIKEEIERLLKAKFIRTSRYSDWVSNIVHVIKKNEKMRVCIDFRDLNAATPKDAYPMPIAETMIDAVAGNEILSLLDGYSGYNQIYIAKNDVSKTAFRCPGALGTYEWVVMPFGLKNASATYQRAINLIFHDLIEKFMQVYIDDKVIGSKRKIDNIQHLKLSFERMRKHGLKMNPLKCAFGVSAGDFLGFVVHQKGIEIDKNKTRAIMETKPPSNKKELQSLLEFRWDENHQKAFEEIKNYLINPPVMVPPSEGGKLKLYVSANDSTIAGMLSQDDKNGIERAIYYISRMLVEAEIRYTPLEKLCLSLYYACTKLKHYIKPYDVFVFCRNNVIKYMLSKPILHSRVGKWALALTEYSLTFVPLKATKGQVIADFLVDHSNLNEQVNYLTTKSWELFFDGSKHELGAGIGLLIISPGGIPTKFLLRTKSECSNNETEYEALITGLKLLKDLGARNIIIRATALLNSFNEVQLEHISHNENEIANELAQIAFGYKISRECLESLVFIRNDLSDEHECLTIDTSTIQDWRKELIEYLQSPYSQAERKVKYRALNYVILNDELFKRGFDRVLFKCLGNHESYIAMVEVHEGICGAHRKGYFWPSMFKDCIEFAKGCEECQKHGPIHRVPATELHAIVKPWLFRGWAIDVIGQIHPPSAKNYKYIIVAIDYFTKWVEAIPVKEVDQKEVINFIEDHIIFRFGIPQTITTDQGTVNATQTTPYKLVYGHEAILPIDINLQSIHVQRQNELPVEDYWNLMYDELIRLDDERMTAIQNVIHQKEKIARVYNKKVKSKQFLSGDLVLKVILPMDQKSRDRGKWTYNWEGPFIIERIYSNNAYLIKELNSRNASKVINGKYLKKFHESSMY